MSISREVPNSDSGSGLWEFSSGSTAWNLLDEDPHDSDGTYLFCSYVGQVVLCYKQTDQVPVGEAINKVSVVVVGKVASGTEYWTPRIRLGNPNSDRWGAQYQIGASYAEYKTDWLTNPATGAAWTYDEVEKVGATANTLDLIGTQNGSSYEVARLTQLLLEISSDTPPAFTPAWAVRQQSSIIGGR
jgi:hypothetical protein